MTDLERRQIAGMHVEGAMSLEKVSEILDHLQDAARDADHAAKESVTVKTADLISALQILDGAGYMNLDLD